MAKMMERVLYYNRGTPETMKHVAVMKSVLVRMGIRIKNVGPEQVMEQVGYLAGLPGYEAAGKHDEPQSICEKEGYGKTEGREADTLPVIPVQMLVLHQFSNRRLDELLFNLRKAGVPKIELKAVLTEYNSGWTFYHLYQELKEEHEAMTAGNQS